MDSDRPMDIQSYELLFREYFIPLTNFANSFLRDMEASKEIVQEVFINMWKKRDEMESGKQLKSYLYTSVRNRSFNYLRDHKKFQSNVLDVELADYDSPLHVDDLEVEELNEKIQQAIDGLPERCGEIFRLSRFEELKYGEIAEKLGISVKTVEAQMSKALKVLKSELKDYLTLLILFLLQ